MLSHHLDQSLLALLQRLHNKNANPLQARKALSEFADNLPSEKSDLKNLVLAHVAVDTIVATIIASLPNNHMGYREKLTFALSRLKFETVDEETLFFRNLEASMKDIPHKWHWWLQNPIDVDIDRFLKDAME